MKQGMVSRLLQSMPDLVPFVAPEALEARLGVKFRLRMGANESAFGPSPLAVEAMRAASSRTNYYGDPQSLSLREALADRHGVQIDRITVGAGIDELLILLSRAFIDPGERVVTSLGGYSTFEFGVRGAGGTLVRVAYREDVPDLAALAETAYANQAKMVYLANPDNPSGAFFPAAGIQDFRRALPAGCLLVLDEAYADFVSDEDLLPSVPEDTGIVRLRTFSKAYGMAGARVGFALGHPGIGAALNKVRPHFGVNAVGQAGALAALKDEAHLERVVRETAAGRQQLRAVAARAGLESPHSWTNFVLMDAGAKAGAEALLDRLLRAGVFVRKPGQAPLDRFIRVSVGLPEENRLFEEILRQVL